MKMTTAVMKKASKLEDKEVTTPLNRRERRLLAAVAKKL